MKNFIQFHRRMLLSWGLLLAECIVFATLSPRFLTSANVNSLIYNSLEAVIVVLGMSVVLIARGINLAVGEMMGMQVIIAGRLLQHGWPLAGVIVLLLLVGSLLGLIVGGVIAVSRAPDLIATIGFMYIFRAMIFLLLGGQWLSGVAPLFPGLAQQQLLGIPGVVWWVVLLYGVSSLLMNYLPYGRWVYAVGSSPEAAELMGIRPAKIKIITHTVLGVCTAVAAMFFLNRLGGAEINVGKTLSLSVIAGALIGGVSINGGSGSVWGALAGVLFMSVLRNGINLVGIPSLWEYSALGLFILLSIVFDASVFRKKKSL